MEWGRFNAIAVAVAVAIACVVVAVISLFFYVSTLITIINSTYNTFFLPYICYQLAMRSQDKATPAEYSLWTSTNVDTREKTKW